MPQLMYQVVFKHLAASTQIYRIGMTIIPHRCAVYGIYKIISAILIILFLSLALIYCIYTLYLVWHLPRPV